MLKIITGFVAGLVLFAGLGWQYGGSLMVKEYPSPYGLEETVARIQHNIEATGKGWTLSGLRSPSNAIRKLGATVPNVLLVEACSTDYSKPIIKARETRILSILMPCTITVYEDDEGEVFIGMLNTALMGRLFGAEVTAIMKNVAADQAQFINFDPNKPTPKIIPPANSGAPKSGAGIQELGGC
ncbi:DUF302 domain-containing protein [Alisedimentitalea sp. MJ-SS2]|uniref:DUF302 domain-containing protein n=1 Tax=Aliisedimentitalea sp. MJ-SS2 TaxID=3049795 RepID=UPI00290F2258|nr:DUF302 domain-containing protein [Alisedimentitalea sp. MJ-SS2]MDU8926279.1 DUF302 domain-containing protein [Alisedimentitalea sp. MJ-SS2]